MDFSFDEKHLFAVTKASDNFTCCRLVTNEVFRDRTAKSYSPVPDVLTSLIIWWGGYRDSLFADDFDVILGKVTYKNPFLEDAEPLFGPIASSPCKSSKRALDPGCT